jgi:hypothetical protein
VISVVDPDLSFSDPDPTFQLVSDPAPDPLSTATGPGGANREVHRTIMLFIDESQLQKQKTSENRKEKPKF